MRLPRSVLVALLTISGAVILALPAWESGGRLYPSLSCSPFNAGPGGTSSFRADLERSGALIMYGGPQDAMSMVDVILIIGPDRPFKPDEARVLADAVRGGVLLLVADESGMTKGILEALGLPGFGGYIINATGQGEWRLITAIECPWGSGPASKARGVNVGSGGHVVCRYADGSPAAVIYSVGRGRVLVVGDSSVFANYFYEGGLGGSRVVALGLLESLTGGELRGLRVLFDVEHYDYIPVGGPAGAAAGLLAELSSALGDAREWVESQPLYFKVAILLSLAAPWPAILLAPSPRPGFVRELERAEEALLSILAARVGAPPGSEPEDLEKALAG